MYVPGKLKDTGRVLVDIGTGFYVEKVTSSVINCTSVGAYIIILCLVDGNFHRVLRMPRIIFKDE